MKNLGQITAATSFGICLGLFVASNGFKSANVALSGLIALPVGFITHLMADTKAANRLNEAVSKADEKTSELKRLKSDLYNLEDSLKTAKREAYTVTDKALILESKLNQSESERKSLQETLDKLSRQVSPITIKLQEKERVICDLEKVRDELESKCLEWEEYIEKEYPLEIAKGVEEKFQVARKEELERIYKLHDELTSEAIAISEDFQIWAEKISNSHIQKDAWVKGLNESFHDGVKRLQKENEIVLNHLRLQIEALVQEKEQLNINIANLQQQLAGDLVEPSYLQCGYDLNGRIANSIAEWLWTHYQLPLKVCGFEINSDGTTTVGFTYSRSVTAESLSKTFENVSGQMTRNLGLYALEKPQKLNIADVFTVRVRRERPTQKTDKGSLYRSKEEFVKYILSQPVRHRIIGEPGSGKTPSTIVLLSHILKNGFQSGNTPDGQKLPYCIVEYFNPLDGVSVKNGDELDFCHKWSDAKKGFKGLAEEYRYRKNPANAEYKNAVGYIWVCDEIDNAMADITKDDAKPFKDALKDGGHVNLGVIVMGQSANVSTSKGLSIDDQKMMTNIYIDPVSIRTFLTQYGERFYGKKTVEKALATLEELELEIEEKNEVICDTAREFRIGMVTAKKSPVFYQLPYFDSAEIDEISYQKTVENVRLLRVAGTRAEQLIAPTDKLEALQSKESAEGCASTRAVPTQVSCPQCASPTKKNGTNSKGIQMYICKNPECKHRFTL